MLRNIRTFIFCLIAAMAVWPDILMPKAYGLAESTGPDGSNAQGVHALGETGKGVNVSIISARNTRVTHEAFKDPNGVSHADSRKQGWRQLSG